ncbi:MAG: hypothetical protein OEW90_05015 [Betaproteobacteria bacterium]|nr:hypothetical protein [Betaproteobacteria bacterium]MDH4323480.1 hypothetical protein [Betaproteobacteria bacterium]
MGRQLYSNNAKGRLNAGIGAGDTACTLGGGQGALFPNPTNGDWFMFTFIKADGNIEVCKCTARSGDSFTTIVRAQEGTSALVLSSNDRVEARMTKGSMEWWQQRGELATVTGNTSFTAQDFPSTKRVTAAADLTLPAASALANNDLIDVKSLTSALVRFLPGGGDSIDGGSAGAPYVIPPFSHVRLVRVSANDFIILSKPPTGKQAVPVPAMAMNPRQTSGCGVLLTSVGAAGQPDVPYLPFDGAAKEFAGFLIQMPKGWNRGAVSAAFAWRRASGSGAANVVWGIRAVAVSDNDTPVVNFGSDATVVDDAKTTTANFSLSGETGPCTIAGSPAEGDLVFFEVFRDGAHASDTLDGVDAWLSSVTLFITTEAATDD